MIDLFRQINMGGLRTSVVEDFYPDGRRCYVASYPDIDGCVAYADKPEEALAQLEVVRQAWADSDMMHTGGFPTITAASAIFIEDVPRSRRVSVKQKGSKQAWQTA